MGSFDRRRDALTDGGLPLWQETQIQVENRLSIDGLDPCREPFDATGTLRTLRTVSQVEHT